jgi:hypothetical protein
MKNVIFTLFLSTSIFYSSAQSSGEQTKLRTLTKLDLGLQGVGFTFEPRLSKNMTMELSAGAGGGYNVSESEFHYEWNLFDPAFYFSVTPKLYYNRLKRMNKGKSIRNNSGNYFGLRIKYTTPSLSGDTDVWETMLMNIHWGLQRPLGYRWTFNTSFGVGYAADAADVSDLYGTLYPALDVKFSYVFSKPR